MTKPVLLPCPFCGGPAGFEECAQGSSVQSSSCTWSVGCQNSEEDCIGYQMLAHYNRKSEAAEAWNKRSIQSPISPQYAAELGRQVDELEAENAALREALHKIAHAPPGYGHGPTLSESIQIARKALGEQNDHC